MTLSTKEYIPLPASLCMNGGRHSEHTGFQERIITLKHEVRVNNI